MGPWRPYPTLGGNAASTSPVTLKSVGFRCIVNRSSKRLVYQGELREGGKRHTVYKRLGDPEHVKVGEARARALEELARLARLTDSDAKAGITFGQAWDDPNEGYKARLAKKKRSERTIADYQQKFTAHLEPTFGKVALRDISPLGRDEAP